MNRKTRKQATRLEPMGTEGLVQCRQIVAAHQAAKINEVLVDVFTASVLVQVHDGLRPENQAAFLSMPVARACEVAFKVVERAKAR